MRFAMLLFCVSAVASEVQAKEFFLLNTDSLQMEYSQLNPQNRDPYAPQYTGRWRERAALLWDSTLLGYGKYRLIWNHNVHTETIDSGAVKTVGWEWRAAVRLGDRLEVGHHHHSKHIMDEDSRDIRYGNKGNQFPVEDSLYIRVRFLGGNK